MTDLAFKHRATLAAFLARRNLNPYNWATRAGVDPSALQIYLHGKPRANPPRPPSESMTYLNIAKLAAAEKVSVAEMMGERFPREVSMGTVAIPWMAISGKMGGGFDAAPDRTRNPYRMPNTAVETALLDDPKRGLFFEADSDAMAPDIRRGDALCVDTMAITLTTDQRYYCVWNGVTAQIAALMAMPRSRVRFMAETATAATVEYDLGAIDIVGRIVWRAGGI